MGGHQATRMSPVTDIHSSNNRQSPIMGAPGQSASNRQSPLQPNRQSPFMNRQSPLNSRGSPLDGTVRSSLANPPCESPTARYNHSMNSVTDLSRHASLSENSIPNSMALKSSEAARSLNSLCTPHPRPLLSEQYETLSDDES